MFNKSQIQAISHMDGPAMVLAGPGSGKTTVITHRIKNLIEKAEVRPENILVVTFTKAAAISMQKRFSTLMNGGKGQLVTFGTFHSVFYKILRKSRRYEATEILSERQKTDYIREIIGRYGISSNDISELSQNIINDIGNIKGNMLNAQEYEPSCCKKEDFIKVYNAYNLELKKDGKMDFDDILRECYLLLCENHTILEQWRELYKYILIDEFQDINRIQMNIIELLASPLNNIFVVGDSAGAQLATQYLIICTNPEYAKHFTFIPSGIKVRAVGLNCGVYDTSDPEHTSPNDVFVEYTGKEILEDTEKARNMREELNTLKYMTGDFPPAFVTSAVHDFILKNAQPMYEKLQSLGIDSEVHIYGSKEKEEVGHVFHVNCRLPEADQCNDEECAFFNRYVV